ncbi:MAG: hypothetical protein GY950_05055 [bacterium]|nr:hypothetical protein [bacterium]
MSKTLIKIMRSNESIERLSTGAIVIALMLLIMPWGPMEAGEPYAPVAGIKEVQTDSPKVKTLLSRLKRVKVPDKSSVGIPAYPGAEIIQTAQSIHGFLPYVILVSNDDPETVAAFYKEKMTGWQQDEINKTIRFWKGRKRDCLNGRGLLISIRSLSKSFNSVLPGKQTRIRIAY